MFRTKIWEIQVLISSFDFIRIEYQCSWRNVLRNECLNGYQLKREELFHCMSLTFRKGSILNRILRSCELSEGNRFVFMENPREGMCQGKDIFSQMSLKCRSSIWHNLFNNEACQKALKVFPEGLMVDMASKNIASCTVSYAALPMKTDLQFQPTLS